jgi:hypothetical protein
MRPRQLSLDDLRLALREQPGIGASELARRLQVSRPSVSRGLADLGDEVARIGRGPGSRYALVRPVDRYGKRWPLHRIDAQGRPEYLGEVSALHGGSWHLASSVPRPAWTQGEFRQGMYPNLPWFLDDLRPNGFLGRSFVSAHAAALDVPADLALWKSEHVLAALLRYGDDLPGDLVLGEAALTRALQEIVEPPDVVEHADRSELFLLRAQAALQGSAVGSSAGGEQPKFTALLREAPGQFSAAVVKFSEPAQASESARRWADLLRCEHLAGMALHDCGVAAAPTEILEAGGRCFLQSTRFDRTPTLGRRGQVSLRALDAAYLGRGREAWTGMADLLLAEGWIDASDAEDLRTLGLFGELIGNIDMHFGNVAFELADSAPFKLVPAFDMVSMLYAPGPGGALVEREFTPPVPLPRYRRAWARATSAACGFWTAVQRDASISDGFRKLAQGNGQRVQALVERFG